MRIFAVCLTALLIVPIARAQETGRILDSAYSVLRHSPPEAVPLFEQAVGMDSTQILARRQLGSLYIVTGRHADALREFEASQRLLPSDTTLLQIAYLQNILGRNGDALRTFEGLRESRDSSIAGIARGAALTLGLQVCAEQEPWWWRVYAAPYYDSRFSDLILMGSAYGGHYIGSGRRLSWYGTAGLAADTRSKTGTFPEIYADNYLLAGGGLRAQPFTGLTADLQVGLTADLVRRPGKSTVNPDFRLVASYGNGLYPSFTLKDEASWPWEFFADGYASAGYYTRYENVIGYLQGRAGARAFSYKAATVDLYGRVDFTWDTRGDFFNNTVELSPGIRVIPHQAWGVQILLEHHLGQYVGSDAGNPYGKSYSSTRLFIILDRFFCW